MTGKPTARTGKKAPATKEPAPARLAPLPGAATLVSLIWHLKGDPPEVVTDQTEAVLGRSPGAGVVVEIGGRRAMASPLTPQDERALQRLLGQGQAYVAVVLFLERNTGGPGWPRLDLNIYLYTKGPIDTGALAIGVVDKEFRSIHRAAGDQRQRRPPEWALDWLRERLVLPPLPGSPASTPDRVVISSGPRETGRDPIGFRIHGRGVAVDVRVAGETTTLSRVVLRGHDSQQGPLKLVYRTVTFVDQSRATVLREEMKRQLAKLASGEGFLAMWNEYNRKESWWTHRQVHDGGYLKYSKVVRRGDGVLRFHVARPTGSDDGGLSLLDQADQRDDEQTLELEASGMLPAAVLRVPNPDEEWGLLDDELPRDAIAGEVVSVNATDGTIDLKPIRQARSGSGEAQFDLPLNGFLYRAFRGDRRRLLRRREAFGQILKGRTRIANLLSLLEGDPVAAPPPEHRIEPESEAAWACFKGGSPTPRQQRALDIALNTPDIAIIQGPPGTGKTQVIAALQTRLAEAGRGYARLRGSMLLTSYQHAAVDELVERSVIFGLPANKVDRAGRGTTVQIDRWRTETAARLRDRLADSAQGRGVVALHRATAITAGYLLSPTGRTATEATLKELFALTEGLIPGRLADELSDQIAHAQAPQPVLFGSDAEELAVRAVRGIRVTAESFGDDGAAATGKALRRLGALSGLDLPADVLELLERASQFGEPQAPPFLAELEAARNTLLEILARPTGPTPDLAVDPEVRRLLERVVEALTDHVAASPDDGVALALLEFQEAVNGDPVAVDWTLREYTASFAATCQQAASRAMADVKGESRVDDVVFDTVIVDEAARANPLDLMIPLIHAGRRIVLVGDHNQLPQMLEPDVERGFEPDMRKLLSESLFQRLFESLDRPGVPVPRVVTLDTQFRMHRLLGEFVSHNFYDGKLGWLRPDSDFEHGLARYGQSVAAWLDVPPHAGLEQGQRSKSRAAEAAAVADEVARLVDEAPDLTIGVIAFYSAQVERICQQLVARRLLARTGRDYQLAERLRHNSAGQRLDRLLVGTVDAFQGKEFDVVLLSTTRCGPRHETPPDPASPAYRKWVARRYGHLTLRNRLCVAMSRQKRLLITVGAASMFQRGFAPQALSPLTNFLNMCREDAANGHFRS